MRPTARAMPPTPLAISPQPPRTPRVIAPPPLGFGFALVLPLAAGRLAGALAVDFPRDLDELARAREEPPPPLFEAAVRFAMLHTVVGSPLPSQSSLPSQEPQS
ncbi:hypothetical protein GCM10010452_74380 [Crossiella cryophila]